MFTCVKILIRIIRRLRKTSLCSKVKIINCEMFLSYDVLKGFKMLPQDALYNVRGSTIFTVNTSI